MCSTSSWCGADAAEDAEDGLHEERRLDQAALDEMRQGIEVTDVVALELEAGAVVAAQAVRMYSMSSKVLLEDAVARAFEIAAAPSRA